MQFRRPGPLSVRRWAYPGVLLGLLVAAGVLVTLSDDAQLHETLGFLGMLVGLGSASVLMFHRSMSLEKRERAAWRAFSTALGVAVIGVAVTGVWVTVVGDVAAFGPIDTFYLLGYAMLVVTLISLARSDSGGPSWITTILDALVGAIALGALVWTAFFHDLIDSFESAPWLEITIGITYPLLDIAVIVAVMILVIRRSHYRFDVRLMFLAGGMTFQVLADFIFFSRGVGRTFAEAQPMWALNLLAVACWLIAAALADLTPKKREFPEANTPIWAMVWPYLLAVSLLATHVIRYRAAGTGPDDVFLLDALIAIGVVILCRQMFQIRRDRMRVEAQRSELVSSVSHELRTPLTALVGYLALLRDDEAEYQGVVQREMLNEASAQADHLARLVSDLVMLSRGDRYQLPLQLAPVGFHSIVRAALRTLEVESIRIDTELSADVKVGVDADRVQQSLTNLLSNAIRYGGSRILVVGAIADADLVLEVHDDGRGVPIKYEAAIWERFERGEHRLDATSPGLGIGLAIVRAVALSHGGQAEYRRSERLGGACFSVVIPDCVARGERQLSVRSPVAGVRGKTQPVST